jgi:hypothetical protein
MAWTAKPLVCQGIGAAATLAWSTDMAKLRQIAFYGKGGIGKSTTSPEHPGSAV